MPSDALFSSNTAAWLHAMDYPFEPIEVTLPSTSRTSHLAGARVRRSDYTPEDACEVRGVAATSRIRTVADMARHASLVEGVAVVDMALRARIVTIDDLRAWIRDHARHRGIGRLTRAIALADPASESPMESRLRALMITAGLPEPRVQHPLYGPDGLFVARPDLLYPEQRLAIEYDGATHRESLAADNHRQNRLMEAGYRILRFTAGDVLHRPASVVDEIRRGLRYSTGSPN
jgi:hypothetical protein